MSPFFMTPHPTRLFYDSANAVVYRLSVQFNRCNSNLLTIFRSYGYKMQVDYWLIAEMFVRNAGYLPAAVIMAALKGDQGTLIA